MSVCWWVDVPSFTWSEPCRWPQIDTSDVVWWVFWRGWQWMFRWGITWNRDETSRSQPPTGHGSVWQTRSRSVTKLFNYCHVSGTAVSTLCWVDDYTIQSSITPTYVAALLQTRHMQGPTATMLNRQREYGHSLCHVCLCCILHVTCLHQLCVGGIAVACLYILNPRWWVRRWYSNKLSYDVWFYIFLRTLSQIPRICDNEHYDKDHTSKVAED